MSIEADNLSYDLIVEVMGFLDKEDEQIVLSYFHNEAELHTCAKSFELEFVRCWPSARKLPLWERYEASKKTTLKDANETLRILEKHIR